MFIVIQPSAYRCEAGVEESLSLTIVGIFPTISAALEACKGLENGASPEMIL